MPEDAVRDLLQPGLVPEVAAFKGGHQVPEEPGPALATAAYHHTVNAGFPDHPDGMLRGPDIPVAQHRNIRQRLTQPGDRGPVRLAGIELGRGAAVQGDGGDSAVTGHPARLQVGQVVLVDALAHLDGQRDIALGRLADRGLHNAGEQVSLPGQRRSPALAGHLGHRAAEVQVDVVRAVLLHQHPHGPAHRTRVHAVQLDGADLLVVVVRDDPQRLGGAFHQRPGGDHFGDVEAAAVLAAQPAEGGIGDARHRGQHHRGVHGNVAQFQRRQLQPGGAGGNICNSHTAILSKTRKSRLGGRSAPLLWPPLVGGVAGTVPRRRKLAATTSASRDRGGVKAASRSAPRCAPPPPGSWLRFCPWRWRGSFARCPRRGR